MQQLQLYILPVHSKVVFPYQSLSIRIPENYNYDGIYNILVKKYNNLLGLMFEFSEKDSHDKLQKINKYSKYGSILKIHNEERTFNNISTGFSRYSREVKYYSALVFGRFQIIEIVSQEPYMVAKVEIQKDDLPKQIDQKLKDKIDLLKQQAIIYIEIVFRWELVNQKKKQIQDNLSINKIVYTICSFLEINQNQKLLLLQSDSEKRIDLMLEIIVNKNNELKVAKQLENTVRDEMNKGQNQEQQNDHSIQSSSSDDVSLLEKNILKANLPDKVLKIVWREFKHYKQMSKMMSQESGITRNYIETILDLPWNKFTKDNTDIQSAQLQLDKDHFGLEKVKKRILEFLSVKYLQGSSKGNIICLVGAPGVGKTSLGKSIATALGRSFERISLGGMKDSSEIRGHRRTYVGSFPGCIIQAIRKANSKNPVILLDEIDKISRDARGDPSSALLEVLDPEQNSTFMDHYLNVEFDLSNVMFIATSNSLDTIIQPLLDRMEVIELEGYSQDEKLQISQKYILEKSIQANGLTNQLIQLDVKQQEFIIQNYTQELGVRNLERKISQVCRHIALQYSIHKQANESESDSFSKVIVDQQLIVEILGPQSTFYEDLTERINIPGVVIGMAYTQFGGKILIIESSFSRGKGNIVITGQLGDIMKESVQTAIGWIKSNFSELKYNLNLNNKFNEFEQKTKQHIFEQIDLNVHFPAAAIPKDGPSAGVAITVALISLLTQQKVRNDVAMTGEISLKGKVLPIGGVKEKCIAAFEQGVKNIILPFQNERDIEKIPKNIRSKINFLFIKKIDEAIEFCLPVSQDMGLKLAKL